MSVKFRCLIFLLGLLGIHSLYAGELWLEADYLLWTIKKVPLPVPLVTSASLRDPLPGAIGQPGTQILLGNKAVKMNWLNGFAAKLGKWMDHSQQFGIESNFFMLPERSHQQSIHTSGEPESDNVAVPIYDVTGLWGLNGMPGETVFILPGPLLGPGFQGHFSLNMSSKLLGFELNSLANLIDKCRFRVDFIGGFRWLQLKESLLFIGKTAALPNAPIASGFYNFKDSFKTNNNFYGFQIGCKASYHIDSWFFKGFAKLALGCMNQKIKVNGKSQTSDGNLFYMTENTSHEILSGGIFAEPTNRGSHCKNEFAVALETGVNLCYQVTNCFEISLGYNFLWLNQLLRPGEQIDRQINPTRTALAQASRDSEGTGISKPIPFGDSTAASRPKGPIRPKFKHRHTDFWAQGLSVNLNLKF